MESMAMGTGTRQAAYRQYQNRYQNGNKRGGSSLTRKQNQKKNVYVARKKTRLTLRGKIVVAVMCAVCTCVGLGILFPQVARSDMGDIALTSYTVRSGDTLWGYASRITPVGEDVSETVALLMELNDLDSASLQAGQRLVVPSE